MPVAYDLTGQRFERLEVICRGPRKGEKVTWVCRCDCGGWSVAFTNDLTRGKHRSCGCLQRESVTKHGHTRFGGWKSSEYGSWVAMRDRCLNPKSVHYDRYGGRGVTVCDRWRDSFEDFLADMGPKPSPNYTIERVDNDGNYEPGNCRWATRKEQAQNRGRPGH